MSEKFILLFGLLVFLLVVAMAITCACAAFHTETGTFTVTGKDISIKDKQSQRLVFTNVTTYEVEDSILHGRWDSSDVYGRLEAGKTYRATLQGYRIPLLSMYQNILNPVEVAKP